MQSELTKQRNFEETATSVGSKLETAPASITKEDAQAVHRAESRVSGGQQPGSGSITSQVQHEAAVNEGATSASTAAAPVNPTVQSQTDRQKNFEDAANKIGSKLANEPSNVTKEDANLLHSREQRAFGYTEQGGLAAQAQHQVAENEGATTRSAAAPVDPNVQSQMDRQANYQEAAAKVGGKLVNEPDNVTKEEADLLHSREQRAFGHTEKGGLAAQAQHQVAENQKP